MTRVHTILDTFVDHARDNGARTALRVHGATGWRSIDWAQYGHMVDSLASALAGLGIQPGDRISILSSNRPEWHVADLATMTIGAVTVPLYPTAAPAQIAYLLGHSRSRLCFVESAAQLARVAGHLHELPDLEWIVELQPSAPSEAVSFVVPVGRATRIAYDDLHERGAAALLDSPDHVDARRRAVRPEDIATIVYTSGTTGPPRGAKLTHANLTATVAMITAVLPIGPTDRFLSFLPLSHIAERIVSHIGQIESGGETWFARSLSTVAEDLLDCRPTVFFAVPRVWEKMRDALGVRFRSMPKPVGALIAQQRRVVARIQAREVAAQSAVARDRVQLAVLDRTVGHLIRRRLGLDHARLLLSGAAPIDDALVRWLHGVGLRVGQVYGQTEVCGPTSMSRPGHVRVGTVGEPLPGEEVRIAGDGEILVRGPNVCAGYLDNPVESAELIDTDGWLHTGDVGELDGLGELHITGRKKELIATAQGKKIAPQEIESHLRADRFVSQAVVIGEGRPYLVALMTVDADALSDWAAKRGKPLTIETLAADPDVLTAIAGAVQRVNRDLSSAEQVKRWSVLPRELTIDAGELTPTLKIVRTKVIEHFADRIDTLYGVERAV